MKIITRITRTQSGHYLYNGQLFECFVDARRELTREKSKLLSLWTPNTRPTDNEQTEAVSA